MATSAMLDTDIYASSMSWKQDPFESLMSLQRFSTNADNSIKIMLNITNLFSHDELLILNLQRGLLRNN